MPDLASGVYPEYMTAGGKTEAAYVPPPNGGPFGPPPGPGPSGYAAPPPPPAQAPPVFLPPQPRRLRTALAAAGILLAVVLAASSLVVALTGRASSESSTAAQPAENPATASDTASTEVADRGLCTAIAPLMSEYSTTAKDWFGLGPRGTPARDGGMPAFIADTKDWVVRAETVMDEHPGIQPRLQRTLQRYVDDLWLYVNNIAPGPEEPYDDAAWNDSLVAYGGPLRICQELGVRW